MKGRKGNHHHSHPHHRPHLKKPASTVRKENMGGAVAHKDGGRVTGSKGKDRLDRQARGGTTSDPHFIQHAIKRPGALTKKADSAGKSIADFAKENEHASGKTGEQARFYNHVLKKTHKPK